MIIYSTRRGSTEKIAIAIARGMGEENIVNLKRKLPEELDDFIVIGSPIYYERPLPEVLRFIEENNGLKDKVVAVFIVCMADIFGVVGRRYAERKYLGLLKEKIKGDVIDEKIFRGWLINENKKTIIDAQRWGEELALIFGRSKTVANDNKLGK
ncbi:flavodoxin domain-containing protein [Pyrococcus sp. ST04]|uniref:flavodoxin domain-containing protein n=1 Tax=Pyrococcus sp. ST04 TaxID=1183377 RepID=UPI000260586C|nr:flavodoxin domain-containing protein [Pyrococcus sp. ST04]AFK21613.1 hypothetical protein Py04_0006 [Pyrococcus sp. ST04]